MFKLKIELGNAAFEPYPNVEIARILRDLADRLDNGLFQTGCVLHDFNGNSVGLAHLTRKKNRD